MANILEKIVANKRIEIDALKKATPLENFIDELTPTKKDMYAALTRTKQKPQAGFILECKKASPSKGLIRPEFDVKAICQIYDKYAAAISVLTDEKYFQGNFDYLKLVTETVNCPVLNKDFFIDTYQVHLARYYGADAILLMLSVLTDDEYLELAAVAEQYNLAILTEISTSDERDRAIKLNAKMIGINNRNLRDLSTDIARTFDFAPTLPDDRIIISESGIYDNAQVRELAPAVDGFLVGSSLMAMDNNAYNDIDLACRKLIYGNNKVCGLTSTDYAHAAAKYGARFGGLIFAEKSPRCVTKKQALAIIDTQPQLEYVGVFVNHEQADIIDLVQSLQLTAVQLHGDEDETYINTLKTQLRENNSEHCQVWKAYALHDSVPQLSSNVAHHILDGKSPGSGQAFDWRMLSDSKQDLSNSLLAGGLNIENINFALAQLTDLDLFGLDLNSGVETSPGIKSSEKLNKVFTQIRNYQHMTNLVEDTKENTLKEPLPAYFGEFGGMFVGELLVPALEQLEQAFIESQTDEAFLTEFNNLLTKYAGRPTPLTCCRNIVKNPLAKIYLKREDLLHGGAHKTNQVLGQALLAKRMGKTEIIAETGAGQHGVATAIACSLLGLKCKVYMGAVDCQRQQPNVFRMKLMGAEVIPVTAGSGTLKDAVNEALRDWSANYENAHYLLGTAAGPHPFPTIVREFQKMIGEEAKAQFFEEEGRLPDYVIAAVGGGSNAIGMFNDFIQHEEVKLIGVEAGGKGIDTDQHGATLVAGSKGMLHGNYTYIMQNKYGQIEESYSISAGLDYPAVGPQHAFLKETGRAQYVAINDDEALDAFQTLAKNEGIIPALESSHALAQALKMAETATIETIYLVNLSGRGDKDLAHVHAVLHPNEQGNDTTTVKHRGEA